MTRRPKNVDELKSTLTRREKKEPVISATDLLSTSSTLLNLACSGRAAGGFAKGRYIWFVGDSESGKTFLALAMFAEAASNPNFDDYQFIYDAPEDGALMDKELYFGAKAAARIKPPRVKKDGEPIYSETHEDFYFNLDDALRRGPCIYVLDSENSLEPEAEAKKFKKARVARRQGKEAAGDYGAAKAKLNSQGLRRAKKLLKSTKSILLIISQTRDNMNAVGWADKKRASGGRALKFYADLEVWTSIKENLMKAVDGVKTQVGIVAQCDVKKNRLQGKKRRVFVPVLHDYGIDDLTSCVTYLVDHGYWKEVKGIIKAKEFNFEGRAPKLVRQIERNGEQRQLRKIVASVWSEFEDKLRPNREKRYD